MVREQLVGDHVTNQAITQTSMPGAHGVSRGDDPAIVAKRVNPVALDRSGEDLLPDILRQARDAVGRCEAELRRLCTDTYHVQVAAERDQAQLKRFLEEFALEKAIHLPQISAGRRPRGPIIDVQAVRDEESVSALRVGRATAVVENLAAAARHLKQSAHFLDDDRAFQAVQDSDDVHLQQGMSEAREDERRRLARELHDGPAQTLANALFAIDMAERVASDAPQQVPDELGRARKQIKDGLVEIRRFMFELRPATLRDLGLVRSLAHYVQEYNQFFQTQVTFSSKGTAPLLSPEQELTIFRVAQEALQNIRKHAGVDRATVALACAADRIELAIHDDGVGFQPELVVTRPSHGAGLPGMRERAKVIGAGLAIQSTPGSGTSVELVVTP